jgi:glycosyltransferase involved in cell wall biosynthesis
VDTFLTTLKPIASGAEVIVVLQGSSNSGAEYLSDKFGTQIITSDRLGLSAARNLGLRAAQGRWAIFPDDDCWFDADAIATLLMRLSQRTLGFDVGRFRWLEARNLEQLHAAHERWDAARSIASIELVVSVSRCLELGGFDIRLGLGAHYGAGEEVDLAYRMLGQTELVVFDDVIVHHKYGAARSTKGLATELKAGVRRGRGYGALQVKVGIGLVKCLGSAVVSSIRDLWRSPRSKAYVIGTFLGRCSGSIRWRVSYGRGVEHDVS